MCRCWYGQFHHFSQVFLPGCGGHVKGEQLTASGTPEFAASASVHTALILAGTCHVLALVAMCKCTICHADL